MEQDLKISVIIPVYHVKNYIEKCVKSVCSQTYSNLEIILVDDGSTDGSAEICDSLAKSDNRIQVIHKENGGLSDARNAGMAIATGEYIGFVDGDDWIEPTMYEKLLQACLDQGCQVACCRYREVTDAKEIREDYQESGSYHKDDVQGEKSDKEFSEDYIPNSIYLTIQDAVLNYILESPMPAIYHSAWSKLYHKDVIADMQFIKGRKSEDIPFAGEVFSKIEALAYVDEPLYDYNKIREGSIMNVKSIGHTFEHEIPGWKEEFAFFEKSEYLKDLSELAEFQFYWRMLLYAKDSHENLKKAMSVDLNEKSRKTDSKDKNISGKATAIEGGRALEKEMYERLEKLLLSDRKKIKAVCKHPLVNKKYAIRLKLFLANPGLYWFLDGLR